MVVSFLGCGFVNVAWWQYLLRAIAGVFLCGKLYAGVKLGGFVGSADGMLKQVAAYILGSILNNYVVYKYYSGTGTMMFQIFMDGVLLIGCDGFGFGFKLAMLKEVDWLSYVLNMLGWMAIAIGFEYYNFSWQDHDEYGDYNVYPAYILVVAGIVVLILAGVIKSKDHIIKYQWEWVKFLILGLIAIVIAH